MVLLPFLYSHLGMGGRPPALLSRLPRDNSDDDNDGCNDIMMVILIIMMTKMTKKLTIIVN